MKLTLNYHPIFENVKIQLSTLKKSAFYRKTEWDIVISSIFIMIVYYFVLVLTEDVWINKVYELGDNNRFDEILIVLAVSIPSAIALWAVKAMRIPESINPKFLFLILVIITVGLYGVNIALDSGFWVVRSVFTIWLVDIGVEKLILFLAHLIYA